MTEHLLVSSFESAVKVAGVALQTRLLVVLALFPRAAESAFVLALVERFDPVKFCIFQRNVSNFRALVLFCIEADFCNQILIF